MIVQIKDKLKDAFSFSETRNLKNIILRQRDVKKISISTPNFKFALPLELLVQTWLVSLIKPKRECSNYFCTFSLF